MDELLREQARKDATVTLPPRKVKGWVHELKVSLSDDEALRYETRHPGGDGAVAFNLHHHHGRDVTYYAQEDRAAVAGTFRAPAAGDYYVMWENRSDGAVAVTYVVERLRSSR